jgi:NAD(P)-dependent dehydrogenase (short-subunit alcohol dehydrogenase family)
VSIEEFYATMAVNARIPLGRVGRAEEFADLAAFLLSPRSSYVTGVGISIDGGMSPVI